MVLTFENTLTQYGESSDGEAEGLEIMLETSDMEEKKDLVENKPLKDLQDSAKIGNESVNPIYRVGLPAS